MSAGFAEDMAANKATLHPMFQVLEAKDIWAKGKGQLVFTAATKAGAVALRKMPYIQFGIKGKFSVHLMPDTKAEHTLLYSIVGDSVPAASFTKGAMLHHLKLMSQCAKLEGQGIADQGQLLVCVNRVYIDDLLAVIIQGELHFRAQGGQLSLV